MENQNVSKDFIEQKISKCQTLRKEQLIGVLRKKKECHLNAQNIVEALLQPKNSKDDFLSKVKNINQCHYEDVVEERFILKLCGYPLCDHYLTQIPLKKYQISTMLNKVFDISERKKFCGTSCYKASEYIKSQMFTGPLWMRKQEVCPDFKLLTTIDC